MMDTSTNSKSRLLILWCLLLANTIFAYDKQDTLRGSNGAHRAWWDVQRYDLLVSFDTARQAIAGATIINAKIISTPTDSLQLDLQELMFLDSIVMDNEKLNFSKEKNVWWVEHPFNKMSIGDEIEITAYYHGRPRTAKNPPWDGGVIWAKDSMGNPWLAVACQGLGASSWWPCKDYQGDEPDKGMRITFITPLLLQPVVSNGRLLNRDKQPVLPVESAGYSYTWEVKNPINTYSVTFDIGNYTSWTDTMKGENGVLDLSFYPLKQNEQKARKHFAVTKQMLHCFEYWMGPYPFYEDGYKLIEVPFLGMEHQSAVAYGNEYKQGYKGIDRSNTGVGLLFDYLIIHESGHEWFGNNITAQDIADNWIHEGFTTYTEALFAECAFGKEKAFEYTRGEWQKNIRNDRPVIGDYGVNDDGSSDKYDKGAAVVHMIRMIMNDDEKFRQLLRGLNKDFYHKIVTTKEIEDYISRFAGYDFSALFNQYLRTTQIPSLEYYIKDKQLHYRFTDIVAGFTLPVEVSVGRQKATIKPTAEWQSIKWKRGFGIDFSKDFLIKIK